MMLVALLVFLQSISVFMVTQQGKLESLATLNRVRDGRTPDDEPVVLHARKSF
jgi:hypothetical protein